MAKVIFLHLSVIHSVHRGGLLQCMLGYHPRSKPIPEQDPPEQTPPRAGPPWEQTPPRSRHPPGADTPGSRHPTGSRPPRAGPLRTDTPPGGDPPLEQTPRRRPPGSRLQHTVYEQPVRILLECILVIYANNIF